jgi:ATP-dependent Clp protease protease subunit
MDNSKEFCKYATRHLNINGDSINYHIENGLTPYILEERELRVTQMDVFSRLLRDRIIWVSGVVNQHMSDIIQAQLLFLDSVDPKKDITLHINSPGGSVLHGLGIVDLMNYISSDVATINIGMCASMGSILLSSGAKGKRSSLIFSKIMTHMVSHGIEGNVQSTRIGQLEAEKYNYILFKLLAKNCGKTFDEMLESSRWDKWFNSQEALEFGLVDEIIGLNKSPGMNDLLSGFEEYYEKEILRKNHHTP